MTVITSKKGEKGATKPVRRAEPRTFRRVQRLRLVPGMLLVFVPPCAQVSLREEARLFKENINSEEMRDYNMHVRERGGARERSEDITLRSGARRRVRLYISVLKGLMASILN